MMKNRPFLIAGSGHNHLHDAKFHLSNTDHAVYGLRNVDIEIINNPGRGKSFLHEYFSKQHPFLPKKKDTVKPKFSLSMYKRQKVK
jgi:hypothetical protein